MALILHGKSTCCFCNQVLNDDADYRGFPHFVGNSNDELFKYSDNAFHIDCLNAAPIGAKLIRYADEFIRFIAPGNRKCVVTGELITKQEDHIMIGYLTSDEASALHQFNFTHIHRNNLAKWQDQSKLLSLLLSLRDSENWQNHYPQQYLSMLIQSITL
ncbi:hypothetical protein SAMN05192574_10255 [Mucilaginibacter gossypiicola]|uniref:Uncharacterized protein n=1 Tax=Mucilaginibacter gossypiicola TaxID=551995 RepID=A0A1H8CRV8_9SPHI|nr:hypothetical protein [Mucilaginibacter gossypiicola]SEM97726.1 hypothetical protein SAMN05192574_10255 [Mucilaginibacter gossypiicola]